LPPENLPSANPARLDIAGCAVEMIHAYSLVHDDLPCMDDDVLRRGKPTCHVEYDEATALLVGDACSRRPSCCSPTTSWPTIRSRQLGMLRLLAQAAGSRGMAGGQMIDIEGTGQQSTRAELEFMHVHKTGALIRAAILLGAQCGTPLPD
jgi:farnesyl diphosphate synthase